jgi:pimeloyl-ACP methyl ester carboxylesterase
MKAFRSLFILLLAMLAFPLAGHGKEPDPRDIIADLGKIVGPRGIQESYKVEIGGVNQWLYVRGQDSANPVILFVHGGPASPISPVMWTYQRPLEEYFTVVNYDQRGAGKTYLEADPASVEPSLHIDRYVKDTTEIAAYVAKRYHKRKVILVGHSWGTIVGMKAALARPDLFYAYVGIGQVINAHDNERISFDFAVEQARQHGNTQASAELAGIAPYPGAGAITREKIIVARKWAQYYGGLTAFRSESGYYFNAPLLSPEYDRTAVAAIDQGSMLTLSRVLDEFLAVDLKPVRRFPIPVIMFMGRHDYSTPSAPTQAWLDRVQAPYKKGVWFENSSHLVQFEEPGKTLVSLLQYARPLATKDEPAAGRRDPGAPR